MVRAFGDREVRVERWSELELHGWGRYPRLRSACTRPERVSEVHAALADRGADPLLAHGLGRSYGDAALLEGGKVVLTRRLDRMLDFDPATGWVRCEAGVSIEDLVNTFLPRGFFPPVVPGTQFVTLGGAIANDIHGKNHHVDGTFCDHIRRVELLTAAGAVVVCDADHEPELFWATVGGLGLTGLILSCELKLVPVAGPLIEMESVRVENLDHFFAVSAESAAFTHTVSWIDCVARGKSMGRGIFMRGRHAAAGAQASPGVLGGVIDAVSPLMQVPLDAPNWLMNKLTMRLFNETYYRKQPHGTTAQISHYAPFFFPLDFVRDWNRVYGDRGLLQYQLVVPPDPQHRAIRQVLEAITETGMGSFLAVIKEFGDRAHPGLSFPQPGVTLALDFPNHGRPLLDLLDRLDRVVLDAGGRVYLGKDARLSRAAFEQMYPDLDRWRGVRDRWDPQHVFQSSLGRRLGLSGVRR